jgi:hypothetical protein
MDLAVLFVSAFAASTVLPMSSEVVLAALAGSGSSGPGLPLALAAVGNTLGAVATGPSAAMPRPGVRKAPLDPDQSSSGRPT